MTPRKEILVVGLLVMLCAGCAVGPNYKRPAVPAPPEYRGVPPDQTGKSVVASFGEQKWWDAFQDEVLSDLIRTALKQNYDVRIAAARILQARAQVGISRADQLPSVSAGASAVNERIPQTVRIPSIETSANQVSLSLAWELDFWGKFRRATESARANLLSQEWAQREVIRSLVSDVASAYFQLRELDLELEISRQTLASRKDSLRLTQILADGGATSMLDVRQAEQLVFTAAASIPDLERRIEQQENFISILGQQYSRSRSRKEACRSAPCTGSSCGTSVRSTGASPGYPRSGTAIDCCECADRRRQSILLSADITDSLRRLSKLRSDRPVRGARRTLDIWR